MLWFPVLCGVPLLVLLVRKLSHVPKRLRILNSPYTRPGPWHYSKIFFSRVWLAYRLVKQPRRLKYDMNSKNYDDIGLVASKLENDWERPKKLEDKSSLDGMLFYGTDGFGIFLKMVLYRLLNRQAQLSLLFILPDGTSYELPNAPDTLISDTDGRENLNAGGIKFQMIEAMRKWRIVFNGLAKRRRDGKESEVHLRINLIWTAFSRPYEIKQEFSRKLLAEAMAREMWRGRKEWWRMSQPNYDGVDQWGVMSGTYQEGSLDPEKELYLRGIRQRRWGQDVSSTLHRKVEIIGSCEDGNYFYLQAVSDSSRLTHEVSGHLSHPNGFLYTISKCSLDLEKLGEKGPMPPHFSLRFSANRRHYHAIISLQPQQYENFTGRPWRHQSIIHPCHLTLNARKGRVLLIATNTFHGHCPMDAQVSSPYLAAPSRPLTSAEHEKLVLLFSEEACQYESLVGGKGSSLALMSSASKRMSVDCTVPSGFCLTVNAWKRQIDENKDLLLKLNELQDVAKGLVQGSLEETCKETSATLASAPVDSFVRDCIREAFQELFGDEVENKRLAVRSSAIGEDGEDLSSAGQNVTVLGCKGFDAVIKGLQQCWSSLLAYQSVEYRRQHGEPLIPGMGVVVQEMVESEVAGVLFTVNPNDGNPSQMILTANFGLGESVVSGDAEPDTFILHRTSAGLLSVSERTIGSKHLKIVLTQDGTREEALDADNSATCCMSDEMALNLGQLGIFLEKSFGGPRDIEFGIRHNTIYLLQSRPVTSLDSWTDYELRHEFDSPVVTPTEYLTRANIGEGCPFASSPLCISTSMLLSDFCIQESWKKLIGNSVETNPWAYCRTLGVRENKLFINVLNGLHRFVEAEISDDKRAADMAAFGHIITTPALHQMAIDRFGILGFLPKSKLYLNVMKSLFTSSKRVEQVAAEFANYSFPVEAYNDCRFLYEEICARLPKLRDMSHEHFLASTHSSATQSIAFTTLLDGRKEWTTEIYNEMAQLLGSIKNVESAGVPVDMKVLGKAILKCEYDQEFVKESTDDALKRLEEDQGPAGILFQKFLERHGHRGIMEGEFYAETWGLDPRPLIYALQTMVSNPSSFDTVANKENDNWLKNIQKTKPLKYRVLKFIVPRSRYAVACREKTKSMFIRTVHCFRLAYRRLGHLMVRDGLIPDAGLVFFFTHSELHHVIHSRGAMLINKAIRRRKLQPQLDALVFPEMSIGVPKPIQDEPNELVYDAALGVQIKGTPVYRGTVHGTVRVALNLEEARHIQCGEILITRSTDIGWSPYFPLVSGVVTELGGLVSHGAVVAREYGLPCIVGAQKATHLLRTGDRVILDGSKGTITRIIASDEELQ